MRPITRAVVQMQQKLASINIFMDTAYTKNPWSSPSYSKGDLKIQSNFWIAEKLEILENPSCNILLGFDVWVILSLTLTFIEKMILKAF
jgi:hypothetical protein